MTETPAHQGRTFFGFPFVFWLANFLELLERGAYYGMLAIFSYHVVVNLGMSPSFSGLAIGVLQPFLYFVPIIAAPIAAKYGYRKSLLGLFVFLAAGYYWLATATTQWSILFGIAVFGAAAGFFKPIIASIVSHTTDHENRNLGYGLYYWMINAGAFLMPLIIGLTIPESQYHLVFYLAAGAIAANLLFTVFLFRNPVPPQDDVSVGQAISKLGVVIKDWKFTSLLLLYSGFWFVYAMNHVVLPLYMVDFTNMPSWFSVAFLGTINPGTIILLGPIIGKAYEKFESLPVMILGILVFSFGFFLLGAFPLWPLFLTGVVLASIGEYMTHPNFLSYVSKVSPKEKVDLYMGYVFLPIGIGYTTGSIAGGYLYEVIALEMLRPKFFWGIVVSVSLASVITMLLYNRYVGVARTPGARAPGPVANFMRKRRAAVAAFLLVPLLIFGTFAAGTEVAKTPDEGARVLAPLSNAFDGTATEGDTVTHTYALSAADPSHLVVTFTWDDEPPTSPAGAENRPDEFEVSVFAPNGTRMAMDRAANPVGGTGTITLNVTLGGDQLMGSAFDGDWEIRVFLSGAGDETFGGAIGSPQPDSGNAYALDVELWQWVRQAGDVPAGPKS